MPRCFVTGGFGLVLSLLLAACAAPTAEQAEPHGSSTVPPPEGAASLTITPIDTGFLFFGRTDVTLLWIDGQKPPPQPPTQITPGHHAIMVRSFRDPVASYACIQADFEKAHAYSLHTTAPNMDSTTIWLEDTTTGQVVGEKIKAGNYKDPLIWGPALKALFLREPDLQCPRIATAN
jgi:hypothetical protein